MKSKTFISAAAILAIALITALLYPGWLLQRNDAGHAQHPDPSTAQSAAPQENEIDYYTCAMHPSVKEPQPGRCPICGMDLTPVYKKAKPTEHEVDATFSVSPVQQQLIGVRFSTVSFRDLNKTIYAVGRIDYDERKFVVVNLRIHGWIQDLYVDYTGKYVQKGQPLFTIYSPDLVSAQEEYLLAKLSSESTTRTISTGAEKNSLLETARTRLRLWEITDEQIEQLEKRGKAETYMTIESPISGYVIDKMALKGMKVEPGMDIYKIADLSTVWVYADIYEYELPYVKLGQNAVVKLSSYSGEELHGRITYIFPYLNHETRTVRVRIEFPNPHGKLKPEMYADVEIAVPLGKKLSIPKEAVLNTGKRQIVFVDRGNGLFEARFIELGARSDEWYEVKSGLHEGERVVSYANFLIDSESKIQGVLQRLEAAEAGEPVAAAPPPSQHQH